MSAIRVNLPGAPVRLVDPVTREDYRPVFPTFTTSSEVEVRKATPEELAREGKPEKARTNIRLLPRQPRVKGTYLAQYTDEQILAAVATTSSLDGAASLLRTSQASISRRLRQIREKSA